ncbi:hypothetical protein U1Q18_010462 [Sarracenia purpurea var. burkii]
MVEYHAAHDTLERKILRAAWELDSLKKKRSSLKSEVARHNADAQRSAEAYRLMAKDKKQLTTELKGQQERVCTLESRIRAIKFEQAQEQAKGLKAFAKTP